MFLTIKQTAKLMQVSPDKVRSWVRSNRLEAINVGLPGKRPQWRIPQDALRQIKPLEQPTIKRTISEKGIDL